MATYLYLGQWDDDAHWTQEERLTMGAPLPSYELDMLMMDVLGMPFGMYTNLHQAQWTDLLTRMSELGWHARLQTAYEPGKPCFAGFTPHGTSGWNGRPDHEVGDASLGAAVCRAALMTIIRSRRMRA